MYKFLIILIALLAGMFISNLTYAASTDCERTLSHVYTGYGDNPDNVHRGVLYLIFVEGGSARIAKDSAGEYKEIMSLATAALMSNSKIVIRYSPTVLDCNAQDVTDVWGLWLKK